MKLQMNNKLVEDFKLFAKDKGVSTTTFDIVKKQTENRLTPVILEERTMNVASMDVYSRLLYDRIIYFGNEFNDETCNLAVAQLLYLNSVDNRDISIYINSPGGSIVDGLALIDCMDFLDSKVSTTCIGMAASMGAVLLSCGEKGKRFILPHSRVMLHQPSGSYHGTSEAITVQYEQLLRCKQDIYTILAKNLGKSYEEIEELCSHTDKWYIGNEALELGIVDKILRKEK